MNAQSTIILRSGREMPVMGLGTWQLTKDTARTICKALQMGYRMIDTSGDYGTQTGIGQGFRDSGLDREDLYLVTKVEETEDAYESTLEDLRELGMDYADLMLIHRPPEDEVGLDLWEGLIRAKKEGFARDIGVSNYSADQIQALIDATGEVPVVNQIEWSPFGHDMATLGYCQENGIIIQAYSPLTRQERLDDDTLQRIASAYGKTPAQLLIQWNIQLGNVPIVKANSEEHLREDLDVFDFSISDHDMDEINSLNEQYSALGSLPYVQH
ncbi:MAG TPA: aldo/keto reductase [Candidatus Saccharimonadales bacterium]|nr:aldo/keto reductase [Candidatus Saccharimonadales bacterium]